MLQAHETQLVPPAISYANVLPGVLAVAHHRKVVVRGREAHPVARRVIHTGGARQGRVAKAPVPGVHKVIVARVRLQIKLGKIVHALRLAVVEVCRAPPPPCRVFRDPVPLGVVAVALVVVKAAGAAQRARLPRVVAVAQCEHHALVGNGVPVPTQAVLRRQVPRTLPRTRARGRGRRRAARRGKANLDAMVVLAAAVLDLDNWLAAFPCRQADFASSGVAGIVATTLRSTAAALPQDPVQAVGKHVALLAQNVPARRIVLGLRMVRGVGEPQKLGIRKLVIRVPGTAARCVCKPMPQHLKQWAQRLSQAPARVDPGRFRARLVLALNIERAEAVRVNVLQRHPDIVLAAHACRSIESRRRVRRMNRALQTARRRLITQDGHVVGKARHVLRALRQRLPERKLPPRRPVRHAVKAHRLGTRGVGRCQHREGFPVDARVPIAHGIPRGFNGIEPWNLGVHAIRQRLVLHRDADGFLGVGVVNNRRVRRFHGPDGKPNVTARQPFRKQVVVEVGAVREVLHKVVPQARDCRKSIGVVGEQCARVADQALWHALSLHKGIVRWLLAPEVIELAVDLDQTSLCKKGHVSIGLHGKRAHVEIHRRGSLHEANGVGAEVLARLQLADFGVAPLLPERGAAVGGQALSDADLGAVVQRPRPDRVDDVAHARELDGRRRHDVHGRECLGLDSAQVVLGLVGAECIGELGAVHAVQRELAVGFAQEFRQGFLHVRQVAERHARHAMHQEAGHSDVKPPEVGGLKRRT